MQTINGRIPPALPVHQVKSYRILVPRATHWITATCADADCAHYLSGWITAVDETSELGQRQARYIRKESGRRFTEERTGAGLTEFRFEAGQTCFAQHQARNMRPERFVVTGGDWRGNPTREFREHTRPGDWVEDFADHQDRLSRLIERG